MRIESSTYTHTVTIMNTAPTSYGYDLGLSADLTTILNSGETLQVGDRVAISAQLNNAQLKFEISRNSDTDNVFTAFNSQNPLRSLLAGNSGSWNCQTGMAPTKC